MKLSEFPQPKVTLVIVGLLALSMFALNVYRDVRSLSLLMFLWLGSFCLGLFLAYVQTNNYYVGIGFQLVLLTIFLAFYFRIVSIPESYYHLIVALAKFFGCNILILYGCNIIPDKTKDKKNNI